MGFGIGVDLKVEAPKVDIPKVDPAKVASAALESATAQASAAVDAAGKAVAGLTDAIGQAATGAAAALSSVAGAIADVAVSFTGPTVDLVLEPHLVLDANASYADTHFEKGPIWIRLDLAPEQADQSTDALHLYSDAGSYDASKRVSDYVDSTQATVDVLFDDAPMNATYALEVVPDSGSARLMFSGVPYGSLRKMKKRFSE